MRKSKYTTEQIIAVLKEAEAGGKIQDILRRFGITQTTFYRWKSKYGGHEVNEAKRPKGLANENQRLKTLVADLTLDNQTLRHLLKKRRGDAALRSAVEELRSTFAMKRRRARRVVGLPPATYYYRCRRSTHEGLREKLRELAEKRPRWGYQGCTSCSSRRAAA